MRNVHTTITLLIIMICLARSHVAEDDKKVLYFGYASNLLEKRIRIENPSAERYGIGELKNYRLDFYDNSERWNGATATIVEDQGDLVWGAIWTINSSHIEQLDRGEGVHTGQYQAVQLPIKIENGEIINCRAYQLVNIPTVKDHHNKPSKSYIDVIIEGAIESGLPDDYITRLNTIEHSSDLATDPLLRALGKP